MPKRGISVIGYLRVRTRPTTDKSSNFFEDVSIYNSTSSAYASVCTICILDGKNLNSLGGLKPKYFTCTLGRYLYGRSARKPEHEPNQAWKKQVLCKKVVPH
jgi:hypothetical protein